MKTGNIWEDFEWTVAADYEWLDTPLGLDLAAVRGAKTRKYRPLARSSSGLFCEFSVVEPTPEAILGFARRFGRLGYPVQRMPLLLGGARVDPDAFLPSGIAQRGMKALGGTESFVEPFECAPDDGESIAWSWKSQITLMAEFVRWLRDGSLPSNVETVLTRDAANELDTMSHCMRVNSLLAATIAPRLTPIGKERLFRFRFEPRSLLGAMWLQAAQAAAEGMTFRQCDSCGRPIAIARTTGARSDSKFCSDACKSRSYRTRQALARVLAKNGWTSARIAKKFHTTTTTVRRWIK
jgi:hypothetical protein